MENNKSSEDVRRLWKEGDRVYRRVVDPLLIGREVTVQRSSGELERDWRIVGFEDNGHTAVVQKQEGNNTLQKKIDIGKLEDLNPPQAQRLP